MKILITGGAGFIGSNLVDHFLAKGHTIICLDNLVIGHIENLVEAFYCRDVACNVCTTGRSKKYFNKLFMSPPLKKIKNVKRFV